MVRMFLELLAVQGEEIDFNVGNCYLRLNSLRLRSLLHWHGNWYQSKFDHSAPECYIIN